MIKPRAEMAEGEDFACAGGGGFGSCRDGRDPELCANCDSVLNLLARRDEMVVEFVAGNFELEGDDDGKIIDQVSKAIRALKGKLR